MQITFLIFYNLKKHPFTDSIHFIAYLYVMANIMYYKNGMKLNKLNYFMK